MIKENRLPYLDSIRGIAACAVVLSHCWLINIQTFQDSHADLSNVTSAQNLLFYLLSKTHELGRSAVLMFFVLSGFVLAKSIHEKHQNYFVYIIRRFFRIYPVFLVVIIGSYVLHIVIGHPHELSSGWITLNVANFDADLQGLVKNISLLVADDSINLDRATWTLVHEVRISIIFPIILLTLDKFKWKAVIVYFFISACCALGTVAVQGTAIAGFHEDSLCWSFIDTGFFMIFFAIGGYLSIKNNDAVQIIAGVPKKIQILVFLALIFCLFKTDYNKHSLFLGSLADCIRGVGAVGIIAFALYWTRLQNFLSNKSFIWLGKISYTLYLIHLPILYVITQTFGNTWSAGELSFSLIVLSLAMSELISRFIEYPVMNMGKKLSIRFATNLG